MRNLPKHAGFTLIELLMVILIIAATTKIIAVSMQEFGYTSRYEQTQSRLDSISQAIIGTPERTINGQPDISGFVADVGRLPESVRELIQRRGDCDNDAFDYNQTACTGNGDTWTDVWTDIPASFTNDQTGLVFGWNGPYLKVSYNPNNTDTFTDGWGNESANNYGWVTCLWDDTDDTASLGLANNLPNDTSSPANGSPLCSNSQTYPNYTIYSLGRDSVAGVDSDGETMCNGDNNTYDGDCYTTILESDYTVNISAGINVFLRKENSVLNGNCNFSMGLSSSLTANDKGQACRNAGGSSGSACYLTKTSCNNINGVWNALNNYCEFSSTTCTGDISAGTTTEKTWDTSTETCHIPKAQCIHVSTGGVWTGAVPLILSTAVCTNKGGSWDSNRGLCTYAASTNCEGTATNQLSGEWDSVSKVCDFKTPSTTPTTSAACISAKGSWNGSTCDITPSIWAINNNGKWGCSISLLSCNKSGGAWGRCDFSADTCNNITGGTAKSYCEFTDSTCTRTGGNWNSLTRQCIFPTSSACTNAGFTWGGSSCNTPNQTQCTAAEISWNSYCELDTSANCSAVGDVWNSATTPKLCGFSSSACLTEGGTPRNGQCSVTQAEYNGAPYNAQSCKQANGVWSDNRQSICAKIFYRQATDSTIIFTESDAVDIAENGDIESIRFSRFHDAGGDVINIATGNNAIGIYEHDGTNCTNTLYPVNRLAPIALQVIPYTNLPIINW